MYPHTHRHSVQTALLRPPIAALQLTHHKPIDLVDRPILFIITNCHAVLYKKMKNTKKYINCTGAELSADYQPPTTTPQPVTYRRPILFLYFQTSFHIHTPTLLHHHILSTHFPIHTLHQHHFNALLRVVHLFFSSSRFVLIQ